MAAVTKFINMATGKYSTHITSLLFVPVLKMTSKGFGKKFEKRKDGDSFCSCFSVYAKPRLATAIKYGKVELAPPSPAEIPVAIGQAAKLVQSAMTFKWANLTVRVSLQNLTILCTRTY